MQKELNQNKEQKTNINDQEKKDDDNDIAVKNN